MLNDGSAVNPREARTWTRPRRAPKTSSADLLPSLSLSGERRSDFQSFVLHGCLASLQCDGRSRGRNAFAR